MPGSDRARHWDEAYAHRGFESVSWYQAEPSTSMALIAALGIEPPTPVIDVGGGTSTLVDHLLAAGFGDLTVVDVSEVALAETRRRVGSAASLVQADLLTWRPPRRFGLWHDRAVFHFLTEPEDRAAYLEVLATAVGPGGGVVLATFAEDGPEHCSGLPVARYSTEGLVAELGVRFVPVGTRRETHVTPAGAIQPFVWVAGRLTEQR